MSRHLSPAGDTLVEVILSIALLSMVLFTAWGISNRASQISIAARQRIEMVDAMKEQAEIVKSLYAASGGDGPEFKAAIGIEDGVPTATTFGTPTANPCAEIAGGNFSNPGTGRKFYLKLSDDGTDIEPEDGTKRVRNSDTRRVWMQYKTVLTDLPANNYGYTDLYVRACWVVPGSTEDLENSEFVVRVNT